MIGASAPERRHVAALDGIRGFAALWVACYHFGRPEVGGVGAKAIGFLAQFGWAGVDLFFVLSGFLICGILLDTRDRPRFLRTFYKRRTLRIFPLYYCFLAIYLYLVIPHLAGPRPDIFDRQKWLWTYLVNIDIARHGWFTDTGSHVNALWSLAIEEQFYLIAPSLVVLFAERRLAAFAIVGAIVSIVSRVALQHAGFRPTAGYVLTFTRIDPLCVGALLAIAARRGILGKLVPIARIALPSSMVVVIALAIAVGRFEFADWITLQLGLPVLALGFGALLVLAVAPGGSASIRRVFETRFLTFFGVYSYSLYVWHPLVGGLLRRAGFDQAMLYRTISSGVAVLLVTLLVKLAAATVVAIMSYHLIERPFLWLKDRQQTVEGVETSIAPA
jgi:peptidoglycan/LPS O-acetylase OafA/YrhL